MRTFEEYELIALECKKILFDLHIEEQKLEIEYQKRGGHRSDMADYEWRESEKEKIEYKFKDISYRSLYLKAWNEGRFSDCDAHIEMFE